MHAAHMEIYFILFLIEELVKENENKKKLEKSLKMWENLSKHYVSIYLYVHVRESLIERTRCEINILIKLN